MKTTTRNKRDSFVHRFAIQAPSIIIASLFLLCLVFLTLIAALSTSFVTFSTDAGPMSEHTFFVQDNPLCLILVAITATLLLYLLSKSSFVIKLKENLERDAFFNKFRITLLCVLFAFSCLIIVGTLSLPVADQRNVQDYALAALAGDWSSFSQDGYMGKYPQQHGLFLFSLMLASLFGKGAPIIFEVINAFGTVVVCDQLGKLAAKLGASRLQQIATMLLCIAFFPIAQYSAFVYGVTLGLAFALFAIRLEMDFFITHRIKDALLAAICITLAILFKGNYIIFLIGMMLYALVAIIDTEFIKNLLVIPALISALLLSSLMPSAIISTLSKQPAYTGISSWSWIAMGLQDGPLAPGWYNQYNADSYKEAGFNSERQADAAKENMLQSLNQFMSGQRDAVSFFTQKTASQWNNPTFQGYWNIQKTRAVFPLIQ